MLVPRRMNDYSLVWTCSKRHCLFDARNGKAKGLPYKWTNSKHQRTQNTESSFMAVTSIEQMSVVAISSAKYMSAAGCGKRR